MNTLSLFLAWRYVIGARHEKNISIMVKICFFGILIGSFSLALIMAIMNGFEKVTHEKMQGIHAQIIMRSHGDPLENEAISQVIRAEFPSVQALSPTALRQAIIQPDNSEDITNVVAFKAVDPELEADLTSLNTKIIASISGDKSLQGTIRKNHILIGATLAQNLNLSVGDSVNILFTTHETARSRKITLDIKPAIIGGIFATGIDEFDATLALCSFPFFDSLFPEAGITQISIKLAPNANEEQTIAQLKERFGLEVYSWKELYPALVAALKLEKYVMFIILALITLVASMNIISLLFMQITQKRGDIAILKAMGLSENSISSIFLMMGMSISCIASITGLALACIASWLLETFPFITLPDAYYVTHLPAKMEFHLIAIILLVIIILSFIATWLPAHATRKINIAEILRFEA
ncbi:MAG: ABC transporter permease [Candidatus Babeliales bacterium]|nr:ABC transporter permease [Candidatus Babeliales bacterium]